MQHPNVADTSKKLHILLINVPSRRGAPGKMIPMGLLYVGSIIEGAGHCAKIYDPYMNDVNLTLLDSGVFSELEAIMEDYCPDIIGFGGIASSYGRTKKLSRHLKNKYPSAYQIAGGPLASVYELLLEKTNIDLVFHGETENTLPVFFEKFRNGESFQDIPGVSFIKVGYGIVRNPGPPQIADLDLLPLPAYHLIDVRAYDPSSARLLSSRGCTHRCSFCYRHMKGFRQNSVRYFVNHIKFLMDTYGYSVFIFSDELFNARKEWVVEFCEALEKQNLHICFSTSMRVDNIDESLLQRLKAAGCTELYYGQESGSDTILTEYRKGVDAKTNFRVTRLTRQSGIECPVQIVIGSPSENRQTIHETTQFLINLGDGGLSINYMIPYPETPIWEYVSQNHLIPDTEQYLDEVAHWGGSPVLNMTHLPDNVWRTWSYQIKTDVQLAFLKRDGKTMSYLFLLIRSTAVRFLYSRLPKSIIQVIRNRKVYG